MLLLLYIDTNKQVNSEGETKRPNNGALKCCRLVFQIKKHSGEVVVWHAELLACRLCLHLADKPTKKATETDG